jgi:FAD synthetase
VRRVVATGTFDLLHPGHVYYLEKSAGLGDELHVIVARDVNVRHKPKPVVPELQRLKMVQALKPVDYAILGDRNDMLRPIEEIRPAMITIGFNQHFDENRLTDALRLRGIICDIVRIGPYKGEEFCSSRLIVRQVLARHQCQERNEEVFIGDRENGSGF